MNGYGIQFTQPEPHRCDTIDLKTGKPRASGIQMSTFQHAQKIRSAISHYYGRIQQLGMAEWREIGEGRAKGNPSVAPFLCNYMVSLRRRKVRK